MLESDGQRVAQHERMLDRVGQLPDVARPAVHRQPLKHLRLGHRRLVGHGRPPAPHEVVHEFRNVFAPVAQRWHDDLERVDPKQEILPEFARRHHRLEIPMRGADDPHIDRERLVFTDTTDLAALEHTQQSGLERLRQLPDLVEEERAAIGHLEEPGAVVVGAGKGPLAMAEKFAFDELLRQGTAVDGHERAGRPTAQLMDGPSHELLARARLAADEHRRLGGSHPRDELTHAVESGRASDEPGSPFRPPHPPLERPQPLRQLPLLPHPLEHGLDVGEPAGFCQIVEDPLPHGRHGTLHGRLPGDDHRFGVGRDLPHTSDDVEPTDARHVEIDDHAVVRRLVERGEGRATVRADRGLVAEPRQLNPHELLERLLVVGKKNAQGPGTLLHGGDWRGGGVRWAPVARRDRWAHAARLAATTPTCASGRVTRKVDPWPGPGLVASRRPPWSATIRWAIESPSPVPCPS